VGKIPKETTEEDIGSMFAAMNLDCTNVVVLPRFHPPPHLLPAISTFIHTCLQVIRHQDTQNARNAFATFSTREDLVEALKMNNQYPYDGAVMPIVVSPASAPPPGRDGPARHGSERRGGGGGFFGGDRFGGGDSEKDWSSVRRAEQPSGEQLQPWQQQRDDAKRGCFRPSLPLTSCTSVPSHSSHLLHLCSLTLSFSGGREHRGGDRDRPYGDRSSFPSQRPALNLQPR
jgi:hypothetical protein